MYAKFKDRVVEVFRPPQHETRRPFTEWGPEAECLRPDATRDTTHRGKV